MRATQGLGADVRRARLSAPGCPRPVRQQGQYCRDVGCYEVRRLRMQAALDRLRRKINGMQP